MAGTAFHTTDANQQYAACATTHSELGLATGDFTVEAWVYPHVAGGDEKFVSTFLNSSPYTGWLLCVDADGYPAFRFYDGNWQKIKGTGIWQVNTWYHVAFTYDESTTTGTIYVNGTSVGTNAAFPAPHYSTGDILQFGRASNEAGYYHGLIQNVRISNNLRYTGNFTSSTVCFSPDANTLGLWWLNSDLTDQSANDFDLTFMGSLTANYEAGLLTIPNAVPNTPSISSPTNHATGVSMTLTLTGSAFSDPDVADTHQASQWQLATESGFTNIIWDTGTTTTNKTSVVVNSTNGTFAGILVGRNSLDDDRKFYVRVKYQDSADNWSSYSATIDFTTKSIGLTTTKSAYYDPLLGGLRVKETHSI